MFSDLRKRKRGQDDEICSPTLSSTPEEIETSSKSETVDVWIQKAKQNCFSIIDEMFYLLDQSKHIIMKQYHDSSRFYNLCKHNTEWFMDLRQKYKKDELFFMDLFSHWYGHFKVKFVDDLRDINDDIVDFDDDEKDPKCKSKISEQKTIVSQLLVEARKEHTIKLEKRFLTLLNSLHQQFLIKYNYLIKISQLYILQHTQYV